MSSYIAIISDCSSLKCLLLYIEECTIDDRRTSLLTDCHLSFDAIFALLTELNLVSVVLSHDVNELLRQGHVLQNEAEDSNITHTMLITIFGITSR